MVFIAKTGRNKIQRRPRLLPAGPLTLAPEAGGERFIRPAAKYGIGKLVNGHQSLPEPVPDHTAPSSSAALRWPPAAMQAALWASAPAV